MFAKVIQHDSQPAITGNLQMMADILVISCTREVYHLQLSYYKSDQRTVQRWKYF